MWITLNVNIFISCSFVQIWLRYWEECDFCSHWALIVLKYLNWRTSLVPPRRGTPHSLKNSYLLFLKIIFYSPQKAVGRIRTGAAAVRTHPGLVYLYIKLFSGAAFKSGWAAKLGHSSSFRWAPLKWSTLMVLMRHGHRLRGNIYFKSGYSSDVIHSTEGHLI